MRTTLVLTVFLAALAVALGVVIVWARGESTVEKAGTVTLVGDSLNVGIEPYLADALPGWGIDAHDRVGRSTVEGVAELERLRGRLGRVVVVSLGTNDADGSEPAFVRLVGRALEIVGPNRCLVWATIVRAGVERTGFDEVLRRTADGEGDVRLVEWARMVDEDPSLLAADAVHG